MPEREVFDLYTADRAKTDQMVFRGEPIPVGFYHLVVHICIFDSCGRMLIQQRQPFKQGFSNLWDVSVGGSAVHGDNSQSAAERETFEELGLKVDLTDMRPALTINWERGFDDYYVLKKDVDLNELHLQYEEVQSVRWAALEEIEEMIDEGTFIPYEKGLIHLLFHLKDHSSAHTKPDPTAKQKG